MELRLRPESLAVCRLAPGQAWPPAPADGSLFATACSDGERSLVCRVDLVPNGAVVEPDWRALTVAGPLDFALVGVLAALTMPLAGAGISIFALSTFDTDHLLVKSDDLDGATVALAGDGHTVTG